MTMTTKTLLIAAALTAAISLAGVKTDGASTDGAAHSASHAQAHQGHQTQTHNKSHKSHQSDYQKPGAAVRFAHDLKGENKPGQSGNFTLTITEAYNAGRLDITLSGNDGISLFGGSSAASFDMASDEDHTMNVYFDTSKAGRHYISVQASVVNENGQALRRAYAVPVIVGNPETHEKMNKSLTTRDDGNGGRVITMDAVETITRRAH